MKRWPLLVHAALPSSLRRRTGHSSWAALQRKDNTPHSFLEGPVLDGEGGLLLVDVAWGRILHVAADGSWDVLLEYEGAPNGLILEADGTGLIVADSIRGLIWTDYDRTGVTVREVLDQWNGHPFLGPNDLVEDQAGAIYITDQGMTGLHDARGRILRLSPDGRKEIVLASVPSPNGLVIDDDRNEILLAVTRDNSVWRVPLDSTGKAQRVGRYLQMSGGIGPDGMARARDSMLFVAHLGMGVVWVFDPLGRLIGGFEAPDGVSVTNVVYSSQENTIFVTEADTGSVLVGDVSRIVR